LKLVRYKCIIYDEDLLDRLGVFTNREDVGLKLAKACKKIFTNISYVFAIPRGGVPIAIRITREINAKLDLVNCRKLLIPWNREAGFGAVDPEGNVYVDKVLASYLGLSENEIRKAIEEQLNEIKLREKVLRKNRPYSNLKGLNVIVVDDGIAVGYTMRAAINFLKRLGASKVYIAIPTCNIESTLKFCEEVDTILCLNPRTGPIFAVADAYIEWRDLTDEDVLRELESIGYN